MSIDVTRALRTAGATLALMAMGASAASALLVGAASASAAQAGTNSIYCDPYDARTYTQTSSVWYAGDAGTMVNNSAGTISKAFTHTSNKSLTSTVSAEVGARVTTVVAEVNAKLGVSVAVTASYTTSTTFTVTAPAHTTVSYRDGILKRTYSVKTVHTYTNCAQSTTYGTAQLADNYSVAS